MRIFRLAGPGGVALAISVLLAGCAVAKDGTVAPSSSPSTSREASLYRASRICVENDTDKSLYKLSEVELSRTGPSHPDPAGPLAPGATWCTNGYNSFVSDTGKDVDATVQIQFSDSPTDISKFKVGNPSLDSPWMTLGYISWDDTYWAPGGNVPWERDLNLPREKSVVDGPRHDVHLRRADDSVNFIEWVVTVRS
ncbi:unannotated protein [freshwater metagenome]|uniref:Unannotated protein n=1 Tax=freshwater metagenome TaxID=449393 RepID=A0A6J7GPZ2_9ZZZZ